MNILFVLGFPNPFPGAGWTRIEFFGKILSSKSHKVDVLGTFTYKSLKKRGIAKFGEINTSNLIFNMQKQNPLIFAMNSVLSFIVSIFFLLTKTPDVTVISIPTVDVGLGTLIAGRLLKTKLVVDYRDEWGEYIVNSSSSSIEKFFYSTVKKIVTIFLRKCQLVTTVTSIFADSLRSRGVANVELVPNGADITVFKKYKKNIVRKKLGLSHTDFIIVYNGLVGIYYKFDKLLAALTKFAQKTKNFKLLILGDGPDLSLVLTLSKNLGLCDNVLYLGVIQDKTRIAEILSAGDVGIIPGLYTTGQLPVKFFEYGACGIPVVAAVHSDSILSRLIKEYEIGVAIPPLDEDELAEAIKYIYEHESFRAAASKKIRLFVENNFDRNKMAEKFCNLVLELAL